MELPAGPCKNAKIDKVLIVGPNGNVGRALIPQLLKLGYEVRALQYRSEVPARDGQEVVTGHTLDAEAVRKAMDGVDAVCHLIRATGPGDTQCEKWLNCCVVGAVNLLEAAKDLPLVRYVAGSADNVFGHITMPHHGPINENHTKRFADGYYGLFKILEEELCRQYHLGFGVPTVITRFGLIWTDEIAAAGGWALDRKNRKIKRLIDVNRKPLVRHDVHMNDVVQGVLLALQKDAAVGEDFTFIGPAPYSSGELTAILHEKTGWPVEDVLTDWYSWTIDDSKARSVLGYRPTVNPLDYLREYDLEIPRA